MQYLKEAVFCVCPTVCPSCKRFALWNVTKKGEEPINISLELLNCGGKPEGEDSLHTTTSKSTRIRKL